MSFELRDLKQSLASLSDEDLRAHIMALRSNRRTAKTSTVARAQKAKSNGVNTKANMRSTLNALTPEQIELLLSQLGG